MKIKQFIVLLLLCAPGIGYSQGIRWTDSLSWDQVKAKAKEEHKYIFLDIYATWCGPCKEMERDIYPNDTVGSFFNDKFISVKVQSDQAKGDNEHIRSWYKDAQSIVKQYHVTGLPSFVFLSPEGNWVNKEVGFKPVAEFVATGRVALQPGRSYTDVNEDYYAFIDAYQQGKKDYSKMPDMIRKATELGNFDAVNAMTKDFTSYLEGLDRSKWYTKQNIQFLASIINERQSPFFSMFYPDGKKVDAVMDKPGYPAKVAIATIQHEIVQPFFKEYHFTAGGLMTGGDKDSSEADWDRLYQLIRKEYTPALAARNVLLAKIIWYRTKFNYEPFANCLFQYLDNYGLNRIDSFTSSTGRGLVGFYSEEVLMRISDQRTLKKAVKWMKIVVASATSKQEEVGNLNTYAKLLYKSGKKEEGIRLKEKAIQYCYDLNLPDVAKDYTLTLKKMKRNDPTWLAD